MQAIPAYAAVAARQTLQRPDTPPQSKAQKYQWPPDVRQYVQRAFEADNAIPGIGPREMQEKLKVIITEAAESAHINTIVWKSYPLPQHIIQQERDTAAASSAQGAFLANLHASAPESVDGGITLESHVRKRKSGDMEGQDSRPLTPPWQKKAKKNNLEDRITGKASNKKDKKNKQAEAFRANANNSPEPEALRLRRQRFAGQLDTPEPSPYRSSRDDSPVGQNGPVVGTCQTVEKSYFRLTSAPKPDTVRPLPVLEQALTLVRKKWKDEHNYVYACDQLKALRQDLTVQHIKTDFTVKVYEVHARIALEMGDLGEYNQCQTQLRTLYKLNLGGNPEEFMAYRILYIIYSCNRTDMNNVLADLTTADKARPAVKQALAIRSALAVGNYHRFFRLYEEAPFMGPYLLDMFVQRERLAALASICKAYKPDISIRGLAKELAFHGDSDAEEFDEDAGARQCVAFICDHGGKHLIEKKDDDVRLAAGKAGMLFENAKAAAFRTAGTNRGQI